MQNNILITKNWTKISWLVVLAGGIWMFFVTSSACASEVVDSPEQIQTGQGSSRDKAKPVTDEQDELERKKLKVILSISIVAIVLLFLGVLLLTILRQGRFYRQRVKLGKKNEPTEYVDAWSQYRLDEDDENGDVNHQVRDES